MNERRIVISDASVLIALRDLGQLGLLEKIYSRITVTPEVAREYGGELPDFFEIQVVFDTRKQWELENTLDAGEASAIALALETENRLLIIDENQGRKEAMRLNIPIIGTLGVLKDAKQMGLIPNIRTYIDGLLETGFYLSEKIIRDALEQSGE